MILLAFRARAARRRGLRPCAGTKWTSMPRYCMCGGSRTAPPSTHPLIGGEMRALRRLQRGERDPRPFVFVSERGSPFTTAGFARMIERAAAAAGLELKGAPRTCCAMPAGTPSPTRGHDTRAIQGWLGHRSITSTAVYTALAPNRFKDFWR